MHAVHGAADPRAVQLDGEEEVQALPGAAPRPLQAQDDAALPAAGKVGRRAAPPLITNKTFKDNIIFKYASDRPDGAVFV